MYYFAWNFKLNKNTERRGCETLMVFLAWISKGGTSIRPQLNMESAVTFYAIFQPHLQLI